MKYFFRLPKLLMVVVSIFMFSVMSANCFSIVAVAPIQEDEFLLIDVRVQNETLGEFNCYPEVGSPVYQYYSDPKELTSYVDIPNYSESTKVIVISGTSFTNMLGKPTSAICAYDTFSVKDTFNVDTDLSVNFYMNNEWRKVKLGGYWTETVETIPETGKGKILKIYTITNFGIHKKSDLTAPNVTPMINTKPTPKSTPTCTPTPKPSPKKYSISGYISSDSSQIPKDSNDNFKIEIIGTGLSALTDKKGYFKIDSVPETDLYNRLRRICVSKVGYLNRSFSLELFNNTEIESSSKPTLMIAGDTNSDSVINMSDIILLAKSFNTSSSDSTFNTVGDLNYDNVINMIDVIIIAKNFNKSVEDYVDPVISRIIDKNETFEITLLGGGFAGTSWDLYNISNDKVVKLKSDTPVLNYRGDMVFATWTFEGISDGTSVITFTSSSGDMEKYNITVTPYKKSITINKNETFEITLIGGGVAGARWDCYDIYNEEIVKLKSDTPVLNYRGDMVLATWTFEGISAGTAYISTSEGLYNITIRDNPESLVASNQ